MSEFHTDNFITKQQLRFHLAALSEENKQLRESLNKVMKAAMWDSDHDHIFREARAALEGEC